jgi:hypothetical protein
MLKAAGIYTSNFLKMKTKFLNLGTLLSKEKAKLIVGGVGGFEDGGQCWSTCELEFQTYCLNELYQMIPVGTEGHTTEYNEKCGGVSNAQSYCIKKCSQPTQPANQ